MLINLFKLLNGHSNRSAFCESVANAKIANSVHPRCSDENIAAVSEDVTEHPNTSLLLRTQHLNLRKIMLYKILKKDLSLHSYKIQLTLEIKLRDHFKRLSLLTVQSNGCQDPVT